MRLRTLLPDHLADLEITQLADHPGSERQAECQRGQARRCGPERDVARDVEDRRVGVERIEEIQQHQANSSAIRSAMRSVLMPRDPFTSTTSPARIAAAIAGAAASLLSKYATAAAVMPAAIAASASSRAGAPPTANSAFSPAAAAMRPLSRCSSVACAPSSSISPS